MKDNRTIQFAIGVTVCIVFLRWLLTGDLLMFAESVKGGGELEVAASDGSVKSISAISFLWPMVTEAMILIGVSTIAFFLQLWSFVVRIVDGVKDSATAEAEPKVAQPVVQDASGLVNGLARSVATRDLESETKYKTQIRKPYAMTELMAAVEGGDFDAAGELMKELQGLAASLEPPAKMASTSSAASKRGAK